MRDRPPKPPADFPKKDNPRYVGMPSGKPKSLREALKNIPLEDERAKILLELGDSDISDEATVIVGGTILEIALKDAIVRYFGKNVDEKYLQKIFDFDKNGPISDFSSKIKIAYALGIGKEKTRDDLDKIREIRNYFAHTPRVVSLSDIEIIKIVESLYIIESASLLSLAGLNHKQRYSYAIFTYHFYLRLHRPGQTIFNPPFGHAFLP